MANWHLVALENALYQNGWSIIERLDAVDKYCGSWIIKRDKTLKINFNGLDDLETLPLNKSYACAVEQTKHVLYFYKKGTQWTSNLNRFVSGLDDL